MANEKAQVAKDKGNIAFKGGDYPTAIGHYTSAIIANRSDPTYPLNRAAAYLKLGKYEDAERDCTTVLGLSKNNVKALFRRGQARIGLAKNLEAQKDLSEVLLREPSNTAAQEDMKKLTGLIQQEKAKRSKSHASLVPVSSEPAVSTKHRRVPIKIVDPFIKTAPESNAVPKGKKSQGLIPPISQTPEESTSKPNTLEAVSSRSLTPAFISPPSSFAEEATPLPEISTSTPTTTTPSSSAQKIESFQDAKKARESAKPSRVGGGIFRASGESTIFATRGDAATNSGPTTKRNSPSPQPPLIATKHNSSLRGPVTLFDFTKGWNSLSSAEERWQYFKTIPPSAVPALCKTSLEPELLVSVLQMFLAALSTSKDDPSLKEHVIAYMNNFAKVPRFGTLILLMSKEEKMVAKQVWTTVDVDKPDGVWSAVM